MKAQPIPFQKASFYLVERSLSSHIGIF